MPLIVLCGQPCSGKSTITKKLVERLRLSHSDVQVIDEVKLALERNAAYKDSRSEKMARGMLKAAAERALKGDRIVILDALNNIKGYRYELWCLAKAGKTRYCVIHCELPVEISREWNNQRKADSYSSQIFEDLAGRFEAPDTRNRWDIPLFRINPLSETLDDLLAAPIAVVTGAPGGHQQASGVSGTGELQPNIATQNTELSRTNLLNELDANAQDIVNALIQAQSTSGADPIGRIRLGSCNEELDLGRPVTIPELRRHKRAFMKLATQNNWTRLQNVEEARHMFVQYLQNNISA